MRTIHTNKVFLSAYTLSNTPAENAEAHEHALNMLQDRGISFRVMLGVWQGTKEASIMLEASDAVSHALHMQAAKELGRWWRQTAVLEVDNEGQATMHYMLRGIAEPIGLFREATQAEAQSRDGYTLDQASGRYWVIDTEETKV